MYRCPLSLESSRDGNAYKGRKWACTQAETDKDEMSQRKCGGDKAIGIEYECVCWQYSIVNLQQEATAGKHRLVALDLIKNIRGARISNLVSACPAQQQQIEMSWVLIDIPSFFVRTDSNLPKLPSFRRCATHRFFNTIAMTKKLQTVDGRFQRLRWCMTESDKGAWTSSGASSVHV